MKRIVTVIVAMFVALVCFSACGNKYNAEIVESDAYIRAEWLENNRTYGAYYENPDYDADKDDGEERFIQDNTSHQTGTYAIKTQAALDEIFSEFPEIDFEKEMVLVHCYTDIYNRNREIKSINVDADTVLRIEFKNKKPRRDVGDAAMLQTRVLVIKMDALAITKVIITKI